MVYHRDTFERPAQRLSVGDLPFDQRGALLDQPLRLYCRPREHNTRMMASPST
jgi:hypothetical protein